MADQIQQIRDFLSTLGPVKSLGKVIATGTIKTESEDSIQFSLNEGWDLPVANQCDLLWGTFNIRLLQHIESLSLSAAELQKVFSEIQIDDSHWRWLDKSLVRKSNEYRWFFLMTAEEPQAACLIYHPKPSASDGRQIFYIDFIAVAPWNRWNPMQPQRFKGIGKLMVEHINRYAQSELNLQPGMCLHSLPKAIKFYENLGMKRHSSHDKDGLPYFELCEPLTPIRAVIQA